MNAGEILVKVAFLAIIPGAVLFLQPLRGRKTPALATWLFGLQGLALIGALLLLWSYFLGHRFEFAYVAQYSSRALSPALSLAASWAGQEGSILLWAVLGAVFGFALMRQPGPLSKPAMFFVSVVQLFLLLLLLVKSPFRMSPVIPPDGQGLNPLLEDPWMVVHPPVLFAGYAAMTAPFALAAAALVLGLYREWNRAVWPWALFAVVTLGLGIGLGGVWAYKVLGWGGYWGWDPVENASLIPWLVAIALLHGLLIQRTTGALVRTNLLLSMLGWLTVLGGTYLTRSGVLQDFSVHSFSDSGLNGPMMTFMVATLLLSAGLLLSRWRAIAAPDARWTNLSRESALWVGLVTVLLFTGMVAFGTTAPILTSLAGKPAGVRPSFYNSMSLPLGVLIVLVMAIAPALRWSKQAGLTWLTALLPGFVLGAVAMAVALFMGMRDVGHAVLVAVTGVALGINAWMTFRLFRRGWSYGSGYLGHAGIAIMVLGMVMSASLGRTERLLLEPGAPRQALGYTLTYHGHEDDARGRATLKVLVQARDWSFDARPQLFEMPRGEGMMRKPAISAWRELYLSPLEITPGDPSRAELVWLTRGRAASVGDAEYTFAGFRMESHEDLRVFADIDVRRQGKTVRVSPAMQADAMGSRSSDVEVPGLGLIAIGRIDADNGRVGLMLPGATAAGVALVEVSTKPLVNLVWVGALLALIGTALAGLRRAIEVAPARRARRAPAAQGSAS